MHEVVCSRGCSERQHSVCDYDRSGVIDQLGCVEDVDWPKAEIEDYDVQVEQTNEDVVIGISD